MSNFFDLIDKHKFGIFVAIISFIGIFIYFQIQTFEQYFDIPVWEDRTVLEKQEIEIQPQNIEVSPQVSGTEAKNISRSTEDQRQKSYDKWSENKSSKSIEQQVKDLEKKFYAESGESAKREQIKKELETLKEKQSKTSNPKNQQTGSNGGDKAYAGNVMVDWTLSNRDPHQGNSWYVRNPGYTCGSESSGRITVKIRVDQSGQVTAAVFVPELSSGVSACMREKAEKYALMSRFSYSASAPKLQEGTITYTFVPQ